MADITVERDGAGRVVQIHFVRVTHVPCEEARYREWVLKTMTVNTLCPRCLQRRATNRLMKDSWPTDGMVVNYVICGQCYHGAIRVHDGHEWITAARGVERPLEPPGEWPAEEPTVTTSVSQGFVWIKVNPAGFVALYRSAQFGVYVFNDAATRRVLGQRSLHKAVIAPMLKGVSDRAQLRVDLHSGYEPRPLCVWTPGGFIFGVPTGLVEQVIEQGGYDPRKKLAEFEASESYRPQGWEFFADAMVELLHPGRSAKLDAEVDELIASGRLVGPFARSVEPIKRRAKVIIHRLAADRGMAGEVLERLYDRI